jgi:hypothetical protein
MALGVTVRVPDRVLVRVVDGEAVLLNLEDEQYYGLDEVGTVMWDALTSGVTVEEAARRLVEEFDVEAKVLARDIDVLLEELARRGLVEIDRA